MSQQHNLFPEPAAPPKPEAPVPHAAGSSREPVWMQRISLFVLVLFCVYIGVFVTYLPWSLALWDHNLLLTSHEHVWAVLRLGATRGVISGLGLLDIWIGISEAVNYRDSPSVHPESPNPNVR